MSHRIHGTPRSLAGHLRALEHHGQLHRTSVEIDPELELTEVATRALKEGRPALLVERPRGARFPIVVNHFASAERVRIAIGREPEVLGEELLSFAEGLMPPTPGRLLRRLPMLRKVLGTRPRSVVRGLSQDLSNGATLDGLPIQKCWPADGGRFITYGQVITHDPVTRARNIGIYRLQVFDQATTGMHWQIQKGGGFHHHRSAKEGKDLETVIALGTDPALLLATIAALPEGMDEALFAGFIAGRRMEFAPGRTVSVPVPASAEFVIEGVVPAKGTRLEGPFGDHFGHYSAAAEFPVMQVRCVTHRRGAIYPGIVVGKPPMEDRFLGDATQQILGPLIRLIHKEVTGMWAYYEAGFHNLLVVAIEERYRKEAMKAALGIMGTHQLSLTKCIIAVSAGTDPRDWKAVLRQVREHFDPHTDFILIPRVPLDTLDFTSYTMNLGSKMVLDATRKPAGSSRPDQPARPDRPARIDVPHADAISRDARSADSRILGTAFIESCLLVVKVATLSGASGASAQAAAAAQPATSSRPGSPATTGRSVLEKLLADPRFAQVPLIAVVSEDVDISNPESYIWGIFTRFDCERDVIFAEQKLIGISPVYRGPMGIDATWKPGYPEPLVMDEDVVRRVDAKWESIWK